ncbi:MAG TPA: type II secretion system protein [Bryobacteraceae bacterium]|nr:type II secretion system protein [Bryobacteraceae bacterium]
MRRRRGFTLLEMMVATVIMAVAVVGLLSGISGALRNAARLTDYDRAVQLARLRMNELLVDQRLPRDAVVNGDFDPSLSGGLEAGWRARLSNFEKPPSPGPGQITLDRVELEIWWMSGSQRRTFTLDAFRPHVLTPADLAPSVSP